MLDQLEKHKVYQSSEILPAGVVRYDTTFGQPRFVGVPNESQFSEDASMEGILGGRSVAEVYEQDTSELAEAGFNWEQAISVLRCLATACVYQEQQLSATYEELRQKMSEDSNFDAAREQYAYLIGFGKNVWAKADEYYPRVQVLDPVSDAKPQGDPSLEELLANKVPERTLVFQDENGETVKVVINRMTLMLAETYHMLEKGNQYAMTGKQLAQLIRYFNREEYNASLAEWIQEESSKLQTGLAVVSGHCENLVFSDGKSVTFEVGLYGDINVVLSDNPFCRLSINYKEGRIKSVDISGVDYKKTISFENREGLLQHKLQRANYSDPVQYETLAVKSVLYGVQKAIEEIFQTARSQPDRILLDTAQTVRLLVDEAVPLVTD